MIRKLPHLQFACCGVAALLFCAPAALAAPRSQLLRGKGSYVVVATQQTYRSGPWRRVVQTLSTKHKAWVLLFDGSVEGPHVLKHLRAVFPNYVCFVARPEEAGRAFVCAVHRLTRHLDSDPYTDCLWGIVTGYDAESALRLARQKGPLLCRRVLGGTAVPMDVFEAARWYSEGERGVMWEKKPGGKPQKKSCPPDTTKAIVDSLNQWKPHVFLTSGHATERDWQIGYSYKNSQLRCRKGQIIGIDLQGRTYPVNSPNPKVYLPVGNCLMGHIPHKDCMACAFLKSCGVVQMAGYVVSTWYGFGGWGILQYFFI